LIAAADPGGVRWVRTNPPPLRPGVVVENARTAWLYQSSSVRDIFTEIVPQLYTTKGRLLLLLLLDYNLTWKHEHIES